MDIEEPNVPQQNYQDQLNEDEDQPILSAIVRFVIEGKEANICLMGSLELHGTFSKLMFKNKNGQETNIHLIHPNVLNVGISQQKLVLFIDSNRQQSNDQEDVQDSGNDEILKLILQESEQNYNLTGEFTITVEFDNLTTLTSCFQKFSQLIAKEDEGNSEYDQNQDLQQMICADDIDEDGNIIEKREESIGSEEEI